MRPIRCKLALYKSIVLRETSFDACSKTALKRRYAAIDGLLEKKHITVIPYVHIGLADA